MREAHAVHFDFDPAAFLRQRNGASHFLRIAEEKPAGDSVHHGPAAGVTAGKCPNLAYDAAGQILMP